MNQLKAFVGHSFIEEDNEVVSAFLNFFNHIKELNIGFDWESAKPAEPKVLAEKVLRLTKDKNLFIGICTKKESVIEPIKLKRYWFLKNYLGANRSDLIWKTSDWIIQEIGLCIGKGMDMILLLEKGTRTPGGLQGNLEHIEFERNSPERSFNKILEMIKALIPKAIAQTTLAETMPKVDHEVKPKQEETINWLEPKEEWKKEIFEVALGFAISIGNSIAEEKISQMYLSSPEIKKEDRHNWEARREFIKISFGKGALVNLEGMAQEDPSNSKVQSWLGRAFEKYEKFEKAGETFERAAQKSSNERQIELLGEAAVAFSKAGVIGKRHRLINEMAELINKIKRGETIIQRVLKEIAEHEKDDDQYFGNTEALLDASPDDHDMRFQLAYKYSTVDRHDLALYHYTKIPLEQRWEGVWNNIGVANANLKLASKAVHAYRKSEEKSGTLAMSNIAHKFIDGGFLTEAEDICARAIKIKDYDKTIGNTITRIKEVQGEEEEKLEKILKDTKIFREFYKELGRGFCMITPSIQSSVWAGPKCSLNLEVKENNLTAEGSYEIPYVNYLAIGLSDFAGLIPPTSKVSKYTIRYEGSLIGLSAKCDKIEMEADRTPKRTRTLLGSALDSAPTPKKCLMIISDRLDEIRVYEKDAAESERFYLIKKSE